MKKLNELPEGHSPLRRRLLALGAGALALPLVGCGGGSDGNTASAPNAPFRHGIASGDPLADRVILWTRVTQPDINAIIPVRWEMATDPDFKTIARSGTAHASQATDFTVKVDADNLQIGTQYYYRFHALDVTSPVGRTRTLPPAGVQRLRFAVFCCANYPAGYFHVYAHAAKNGEFDALLHLGDYIYEYERGDDVYASKYARAMGREVEPANELRSLSDYRTRYAQYKTDPNLQAIHAVAPMIAIWDDHEIVNNAYKGGSSKIEQDEATDGPYPARKAAAQQAYHEWLPIRTGEDRARIWRRFNFGNLVDLHMLDARHYARDHAIDYPEADGSFNPQSFAARWVAGPEAQARTMLGQDQLAWLLGNMQQSTATWQILGQQVLMAKMLFPAQVLLEMMQTRKGDSFKHYLALAARLQAGDPPLTAEERAFVMQPRIPYNLDAWDGYYVEREKLLTAIGQMNKNLVVLAGDTHNAWANQLYTGGMVTQTPKNYVGVEFAVSSVSSPGFEEYLPGVEPLQFGAALKLMQGATLDPNTQVPVGGDMPFCDTFRRGYMVLTVTPEECRADWYFADSVFHRDPAVANVNHNPTAERYKVLAGENNIGKLVQVLDNAPAA